MAPYTCGTLEIEGRRGASAMLSTFQRRRRLVRRLQLGPRFREQLLDLLPPGVVPLKSKESFIVLDIHSQDFRALRHPLPPSCLPENSYR
jgi:hypothetical protein